MVMHPWSTTWWCWLRQLPLICARTKGCGVILRHASDSIPEHSQSAISTTTVHTALESEPTHVGWSGEGGEGGGGEGGGDGGGGEGGGGEGFSCGHRQLHAR